MPLLALLLVAAAPLPEIRVEDAARFPFGPQTTEAYWKFASNHRLYVEANAPTLTAWIAEAEYCERAWDLLDDCKRLFADKPDQLKQRLSALRDLIGPENYAAGRMPPVCPYWRFMEIDR